MDTHSGFIENSQAIDESTVYRIPEEHVGNALIERLGPFVLAEDRIEQLSRYPHVSPEERNLSKAARMQRVFRLNRYFELLPPHFEVIDMIGMTLREGYVCRNPTDMAYRALRYSLLKEEEFDWQKILAMAPATAPSFALFGVSGVGKSTVIDTALSLVPKTIRHPDFIQVVWIKVDCPPDGSLKQLLIDILKKFDAEIHTSYSKLISGNNTVDALILKVANVCAEHYLGTLVIDEIQHLLEAKGVNKEKMLNFFVTFANVAKIPVVTVGTTRALSMLEGTFREARRVGDHGTIIWDSMNPGDDWHYFVNGLWEYQWTQEFIPLTDEILKSLYKNTMGIHALVVRLFQLTQLHVISSENLGPDEAPLKLSVETIEEVAQQKFKLVMPMLKALRTGNLAKIRKYEDLLAKQLNEISLSVESQVALGQLKKEKELRNQALAEKHRATSALLAMGYEETYVQQLVASTFSTNPNLSAGLAVNTILTALEGRNVESNGGDMYRELRNIIEDAQTKGISAEDALKTVGYVDNNPMET